MAPELPFVAVMMSRPGIKLSAWIRWDQRGTGGRYLSLHKIYLMSSEMGAPGVRAAS